MRVLLRSPMSTTLEARDTPLALARTWLCEEAWPLWSSHGVDREFGGFFEGLYHDMRPLPSAEKRTRTTARQVYCFAQAALLGFAPAAEVVEQGWNFLLNARRPDGGWAFSVARHGAIKRSQFTLYEAAFVLLAHSWYYRLNPSSSIIESAKCLLCAINTTLSAPFVPGWFSSDGDSKNRDQNSHMHLLEASLDLAESTGESIFFDLAAEVVDLAKSSFFEPETGALLEFFDANWKPHAYARSRIEPGHMMEWVWLFEKAARILSDQSLRMRAKRIYDFAKRNGTEKSTGLIYDLINIDGLATKHAARIWPQIEHLKANVALARSKLIDHGDDHFVANIDLIHHHYLSQSPPGLWCEHSVWLTSSQNQHSRATSLYHIQMGFTEFLKQGG